MSTKDEKNSLLDKRSSRRNFLKNSGLTVGGLIAGGALGSLLVENDASTTDVQSEPHKTFENPNVALMYFTPEQYRITEAATERIFPKDHNGPGAKELLVAYYIDHQLAGGWVQVQKNTRQDLSIRANQLKVIKAV
ncbi:gluconate 2-dehydrogenase subunit 3 family protein [Sporosarcina thermotolerans]|uniref:gluconate 2-dehydrogenase subunit 3 family protein n=1 Tax=Sporosarcina thermotolerans TaxID=633404 RepID=UPI00321C24DF